MVRLTVQISTAGAEAKIKRAIKGIDKAGTETVHDLAEKGKWYAKSIVPIHSGRTYNYIIARKGIGADGPFGTVVARNPTIGDGHIRNISNFNLVRWMHISGKAIGHIKSGDREFMFTTRDYLNSIKKGVATGRFKRINLR